MINTINIEKSILELVKYGIEKQLIRERDKIYIINRLLTILNLTYFNQEDTDMGNLRELSHILDDFRRYAIREKLVEMDTQEELDIFEARIMDCLAKRPSEIEKDFWQLYSVSPKWATKYYYDFTENINYIKKDRIKKDIKWKYKTKYGDLDLSISMSKAEETSNINNPILLKRYSYYPKCHLCKENQRYNGRNSYTRAINHRTIELNLIDEKWFMQYSPYAYYSEHCIVFKGLHHPKRITSKTFQRLLAFVEKFPHYTLASNADLPIIGGEILGHDYFEGGGYVFSIAKAIERDCKEIEQGVILSTLKWPMSVIRLKSEEIKPLVDIANRILENWKSYNDKSVKIISHTNKTRHNSITPIARFRDGKFEIDLILRNNRTDKMRPDGIFHPKEEYYNISSKNIEMTEAMGFAVLPSRLKREMEEVKTFLLLDELESIRVDVELNKHYNFALKIKENYKIDEKNIDEIIKKEIGHMFLNSLEDGGVFKETVKGQKAFKRCVNELISQ